MEVINHIPEAEYRIQKREAEADICSMLGKYDVKLKGQGGASQNSFPIGNGDITANVWTENDAPHFYIGKSDTWSEATRLLKVGKVSVRISPSPFEEGMECLQVLHLYEGILEIFAGTEGQQVQIKMWADANNPVIRVEISGDYDFSMEVSSGKWRDQEIHMNEKTFHSYRGLSENKDLIPWESADHVLEEENQIVWYHYNEHSYYQEILRNQRMEEMDGQDPYKRRCFGAAVKGDFLESVDRNTLAAVQKRRKFVFSVYPYTCQCDSAAEWKAELEKVMQDADANSLENAGRFHADWWKKFWNKSYIFVEGDEAAETVTRGYIMQRYMQAIQGRGSYPIKFNGGTLNFDYGGFSADYRLWGPAYWFQNTRHLYWNMLAAGDFEMMKPFFQMYLDMLPMQKMITKKYYGHEGVFFPETIYFTGLYTPDDFGWNNLGTESENAYVRYYWQSGLELASMMLEYFAYTKDQDFAETYLLPIAAEVVKFYDLHYGRKDGRLKIEPAHILETYWDDVKNPVEVVSGLKCVLKGLLELSAELTDEVCRREWKRLMEELPKVSVVKRENGDCISPAEQYGPKRYNNENPELYPVFPYFLYGVGKENLELAQNTYFARLSVFDYCWSQNGIHAACLGLAEEAKKAVTSHFANVAEDVSFPGFWGSANDWMPDLDNGGSAMLALQKMLLQDEGENIHLFPAWPVEWKVKFKLYTADEKIVAGEYTGNRQ